MQASEFLELARVLAGGGPFPGARTRSSISRAYYSAFLDARDRVRNQPHIHLATKSMHDQVWRSLAFADDPLKSIGRLLRDLKQMREKADYQLSPDPTPALAAEAIRLSEIIQRRLAAADLTKCVDPRGI